MILLLLGLAHGVSDAAAGMLVMQVLMLNMPDGGILILIYNGLAFGMQPVAGLMLDRLGQPRWGAALGLILTAAGVALMGQNLRLGMALAGSGSALFHAGGGSIAIRATPGKAAAPGVFAAPGVIGLAIGSQLAFYYSFAVLTGFVIVLVGLAVLIGEWKGAENKQEVGICGDFSSARLLETNWILILLLLAAVALRSYVWTGTGSTVAGYSQSALWLALAAGTGKLLGGVIADRIGWLKYAIGALAGAMLMLAIGKNFFAAMLIGVCFLQSLTALSIAAMGKFLPRTPALAASLVLGTGLVIGGFPYMIIRGGWFGIGFAIAALALSAGAYTFTLRKPMNL